MNLRIDCSGGFAGDMFTAALLNLGADYDFVSNAMRKSGEKIGRIGIGKRKTEDGATQLLLNFYSEEKHLNSDIIYNILTEIFSQFKTPDIYREFGIKVLQILIEAEKKAHKQNVFKELSKHHKHNGDITFLHEAQDILIDITGAVTAMESLEVNPEATLGLPVNVGNGKIKFSHGILDVPAPATKIILDNYGIEWERGEINHELCTPTGASLLAALLPETDISNEENITILKSGYSRGSKVLPIPPLKIDLIGK